MKKDFVTESVNVKVKQVRGNEYDDNSYITLTLDKAIPCYRLNDETNEYEKSETNEIQFFRSALTAQLCEANDTFAMYRACSGRALNVHQFGGIMMKAELKIEFYEVEKGKEFEEGGVEKVAERNMFIKNVTKVKFTEMVDKLMNRAIENAILNLNL